MRVLVDGIAQQVLHPAPQLIATGRRQRVDGPLRPSAFARGFLPLDSLLLQSFHGGLPMPLIAVLVRKDLAHEIRGCRGNCAGTTFHGDLMRVTSGQTDPVLSRILVQNSKDTVFWMNRVGNIRMEPATSLTGVRKGNKIIWARGLVVRAAHEGVGLSRSWFATAEKMGIEIRYGAAVTAILQDDRGHASGVHVRDDDGVADVHGRAVILGCGGFEANVQMRTQHIGPLVGGAKVRGPPHNQGDGLRMAMAIGAMPWGQWSGCHATPISADWGNFAPRELTDRSNRLS